LPDFKNLNALFKYMEKTQPIDLEKLGNEIKGWLRNNVRVLWYERSYTPKFYERTFELIESITCSKAKKIGNGEYQVKIYFDTDKINPYSGENGMWSQHQSITNGADVSSFIPLWIEEGQNSSIFSYEGVHPVRITKEEIKEDDYIKTRLKELLEHRGYRVE
jgi:hypothetical protein